MPNIKLFPNPTNTLNATVLIDNLDSIAEQKLKLEVYAINGQKVIQQNITTVMLGLLL